MREQNVLVETADGRMETFVAQPDGKGPFPAVIMYQNVGGLSEILRDMARRAAREGYLCVVPDLYYRIGKIVIDADSRDDTVMAIRKLALGSISNAMVMDDTRALLAWLDANESVANGPVGTIGYCAGGRFCIVAAEYFPEHFGAVGSLFGVRLITDQPDSPHLAVDRIKAEVYCGFAEDDPSVPPEIVERFCRLLDEAGIAGKREVLTGTHHGFAFPGRKVYHQEASERTWSEIFEMFARRLLPKAAAAPAPAGAL